MNWKRREHDAMVKEKSQKTVTATLLTHLSCTSWEVSLFSLYLLYVLAHKLLNSGINWTQTLSWDKTFRRPRFRLTLPPLKPMTNSPGNREARRTILYSDYSDTYIFRAAKENHPRILHKSYSANGLGS